MRKNKNFPWWKGAIIYQIYPLSFFDNNNDGIGDIPGIIKKMDYLSKLNIDVIWISPFFKSPMKDFGYDVSDYQDINPIFGSLKDFDHLIKKARFFKIKVIIDQVLSHTSNQHPWFIESCKGHDNPKSNWYVWVDAKKDGSPPNNWLSIFGGSAWQWEPRRRQYYLHNFLKEQPDLNFYNNKVQKALLASVEFWLKKGVNGFRLDTVNFYYHNRLLKNNPSYKHHSTSRVNLANPYYFQKHIYDKTQPENINFLKDLRKLTNRYSHSGEEIMLMGEVGDDNYLEIMAEYTAGNNRLHTCYGFGYLADDFSAIFFKHNIEYFEKINKNGWACWPFSNHDTQRVATRWGKHFSCFVNNVNKNQGLRNDFIKMLLALQITLKGSVCIYQGEELGFGEANIPFEKLRDPYGIKMYPEIKGRDGSRTPMVWKNNLQQAGFSSSYNHKQPWLPIAPEHIKMSVFNQEKNFDSILNFARNIFSFRKTQELLLYGDIEVLSNKELLQSEILILKRNNQKSSIIALFNLDNKKKEFVLPSKILKLINFYSFEPEILQLHKIKVCLPKLICAPFGFVFIKTSLKNNNT
jgi:alpha-glucosidase